jgi:hypothetical protein
MFMAHLLCQVCQTLPRNNTNLCQLEKMAVLKGKMSGMQETPVLLEVFSDPGEREPFRPFQDPGARGEPCPRTRD